MKTYSVYQAKTHLSRLLEEVQAGEEVVISKNGKPIADISQHKSKKNKIKFGVWKNKKGISYKDEDFVGIDPEIQEMFYGKDWDKD